MTRTYTSSDDVSAQRRRMQRFFETGATRSIAYRKEALKKLKSELKANEDKLLSALNVDLGKAPFEGYATEIGIIYDEINTCLKHLNSWSRPKLKPTPIVHFPSVSKVYASPLGVVLVMSPWNYPLQLALVPLVDAIAAGNCVALKPSRTSRASGKVLEVVLGNIFPDNFVCVFPGSGDMNDWLLEAPWDHIFFTGSPRIGHTVMGKAAEHLSPVSLELGGKSPCIVHEDANILRAAQRIAWGKGINSGQTCVAPDYFLVHEAVLDELLEKLEACFHKYYGQNILECEEWPHMISEKHFTRVMGLIENRNKNARIAFGGKGDISTLRIEPTALVGVNLSDPVMKEEIFGPVMPIMTYRNLSDAFGIIRHFEKPLATYIFSENKAVQRKVIEEIPFGGATINDCIIHLANNHMGFGGVGNSGMGAYHGKTGFDTFTHYKSTIRKANWLEIPIRVPPFKKKISLLRLLMR